MSGTFDVDELFQHLVEAGSSSASVSRMFHDNPRRQRSMVMNLEYFTLIGKDCEPMQWQIAAGAEDRKPGHIAITRCSSVIALSLHGAPIKKIKNPARQKIKEYGYVYDPFSPWEVLNIQCYPDWKASLDVHDSTKHYANGPEAFMNCLLGEYRDAERRFESIYKAISERVTPPLEFMFDSEIRDNLLFEDDSYTMVRRYFWAHQTLGIMNESIKAMIDAYEDTFTDDVWEGKHKTLWPMQDQGSQRSQHYKKKMTALKGEFDIAIANLRKVIAEIDARRKEIIGLRDELFSGTSIQESRKSVLATNITVQQGHNIKLLTLVSMCFLPLTFVTSVFGMTNMPDNTGPHAYTQFAIVSATVCIPFLILIGSLNTHRGMNWWRTKTRLAFDITSRVCVWIGKGGPFARKAEDNPEFPRTKSFESTASGFRPLESSTTMSGEMMSRRQRRLSGNRKDSRGFDKVVEPIERGQSPGMAENGLLARPTISVTPTTPTTPPPSAIASMWKNEKRQRLRYSEDV